MTRKILCLAREFTSKHMNGVATRVYNTAISLARSGVEVHVICDPIVSESPPQPNEITVHYCRRAPSDLGPFGFSFLSLETIYRCLRECGSSEVIHGQGFGTSGALAIRRIGGLSKVRTFLTLDDIFTLDRSSVSRMPLSFPQRVRTLAYMGLTNAIDKTAAKASDFVVTVSRFAKKEIVRDFSIDEARVAVIPNGVDTGIFRPENKSDDIKEEFDCADGSLVLTVTHLGYRKGVDLLLRAFKAVTDQNRNARLAIVGTGPDKRYLETLAIELGISNVTYFLGNVSLDRLLELYATAAVFALPSRYEGQGISLLEAMSSGTPVVAFDISDFRDYVLDGVTGLLAPPNDYLALGEALGRLIGDPVARRKMSANARSLIQSRLTWDSVAKSLLALYSL